MSKDWGVLVHGPSLDSLEAQIEGFKGHLRWATVNQWEQLQEHILDKIGEEFELVYCVCSTRLKQIKKPQCTLVTEDNANYEINSLCGLLNLLSVLGATRIYLFGCDGRAKALDGGIQTYYREDEFRFDLAAEQPSKKWRAMEKDTKQMNLHYKPKCKVFNVNPDSAVEVFEKKTYKEVIDGLKKSDS